MAFDLGEIGFNNENNLDRLAAGQESSITNDMIEYAKAVLDNFCQAHGIEVDEGLTRHYGTLKLRIHEDGTFKTKDGRAVPFEKGIKIHQAKGVFLNVTASEIALLIKGIKEDSEVNKILGSRLKEEQDLIRSLSI